jgi:hypothetical protein
MKTIFQDIISNEQGNVPKKNILRNLIGKLPYLLVSLSMLALICGRRGRERERERERERKIH